MTPNVAAIAWSAPTAGSANYIDGGPAAKQRRLEAEGVPVADGAVRLADVRLPPIRLRPPLGRAATRAQESILKHVSLRPRRRIPKLVGGVDVSYTASGDGVAAYALVDVDPGRNPLDHDPAAAGRVSLYHELPLVPRVAAVAGAARHRPSGWPRVRRPVGRRQRHVAPRGTRESPPIWAFWPISRPIGVTKKLLCGRVDIEGMKPLESRPVVLDERPIGVAIRPTAGSHRPIFVSPGHRVDVALAEAVVRRLLRRPPSSRAALLGRPAQPRRREIRGVR